MSEMSFENIELDEDLDMMDEEEEVKDDVKKEETEKVGPFKRAWRGLKNLVNKGRKNPVVTGVVGLVAGAGAGVAGVKIYDHFTSHDDLEESEGEEPLLDEYREAENEYGDGPQDE